MVVNGESLCFPNTVVEGHVGILLGIYHQGNVLCAIVSRVGGAGWIVLAGGICHANVDSLGKTVITQSDGGRLAFAVKKGVDGTILIGGCYFGIFVVNEYRVLGNYVASSLP